MAHPKRRHSTTRRDKRRTHYKIETPTYYIDGESGNPTLFHRVCLASGFYRGKQVMKAGDTLISEE